MRYSFYDSLKRENEIKQGNAELNRNMEEEDIPKVGEKEDG